MAEFSHLNEKGEARMVDVSAKPATARQAVARGRVTMAAETLERILGGDMPKGDVLATARIAGIMAAKKTSELIPMCHPLPLTDVSIDMQAIADGPAIEITASVKTVERTGVEMEALTAVSVAALTLYDMAKAVDKRMRISDVRVIEKQGGKSGPFRE
jgi:cyclic pyranopterin phosphate synthase